MPTLAQFTVFITAALVLALTPGPGILYVLARSLQGGRSVGFTSALGTATGGLFHVVAAALGLSAILATSALAFSVVRYAGAAYLIFLGVRTLLSHSKEDEQQVAAPVGSRRAFYQGILTELLNPKTALFFLAFIPQFVNPNGPVIAEFILLGSISLLLNTSVDLIVVTFAGPLGRRLQANPRLRSGQRFVSGAVMIGLGAYVAASGEQS